ncbi:nitroreductase family protein [Ideonella sp. 4Y16]|uniref:nitroreductase family protein n=1 Tax=Ideonella alba TaxID=2824118 RepID=UPI001B38D12C|nr:nitroreductase family protein [Ideonella alba]MBQ0944020.1 nitroreductase family protein [Ideonella alba]
MAEINSGPDLTASASSELTKLILSRRSVRDEYLDKTVPDAIVEEILRCGLSAPSSKNARPWCFHVLSDRTVLRELAAAVVSADGADSYVPNDPETGRPRADWTSSVAESAATLAAVPLGIFIENLGAFSRGRATLASVPQDNLRRSLVGYTFEVMGIGSALMNMWLAANALGLQASFMGDICVAEKAIAKRLGIRKDLVGVLALGYSTSKPPPNRERYDTTDETRVIWHRGSPSS